MATLLGLGLAQAAAASAQSRDDILVELPDKRVVKLRDAPLARERLAAVLDAMEKRPNWRTAYLPIYSPSAEFCPRFLGYASNGSDGDAESICSRTISAQLAGFDPSDKERCRCVKVLEGRAGDKLRLTTGALVDPMTYVTVTLSLSRGGAGQILRGWWVTGAGEERLHNDKRQLVCTGNGTPASAVGTISCFGGKVTGHGAFERKTQRGPATDPWFRTYVIGRFELSNGERLDFVSQLTEAEIKRFHPNFPN